MIDGFKATSIIYDIESWKRSTGIELTARINVDSGEQIRSRLRMYGDGLESYNYGTDYKRYNLNVIESKRNANSIWRLNLRGSLHKGAMAGVNANRFTWVALQTELGKIESDLKIPLIEWNIQNIEFGVNITWDCPVMPFLEQSLLMHRRKPFDPFKSESGARIGFVTKGTHHQLKTYDKALQVNLPSPLMRIENHVSRMQYIKNNGLMVLSDLQVQSKVKPLIGSLTNTWNDVLMFDSEIIDKANGGDKARLIDYSNVKFWINAASDPGQKKFRYHKGVLIEIKEKYKDQSHHIISDRICSEWNQCFI